MKLWKIAHKLRFPTLGIDYPLDCSFRASNKSGISGASLTVFNPPRDFISNLNNNLIELSAGWAEGMGVIALGTARKLTLSGSAAIGASSISFDIDGSNSVFRDKFINEVRGPTSSLQLLRYLAGYISLPIGLFPDGSKDIVYSRGYSLNGSVWKCIRAIARDLGAESAVACGALHVWVQNSGRNRIIEVLDESSGLIEYQTTGNTIKGTCLLRYALLPGGRVRVQDIGEVVLTETSHDGDTRAGAPWDTSFVGRIEG